MRPARRGRVGRQLPPSVRVGVDIVRVDSVREAAEAYGERYLGRLFTPLELAEVGTPGGSPSFERLAARLAAKEAAIKALEPSSDEAHLADLRAVEVRSTRSGSVAIVLHGGAVMLAAARGIAGWGVSLTHEGEYAAAVVFGVEAGHGTRAGSRRHRPRASMVHELPLLPGRDGRAAVARPAMGPSEPVSEIDGDGIRRR